MLVLIIMVRQKNLSFEKEHKNRLMLIKNFNKVEKSKL